MSEHRVYLDTSAYLGILLGDKRALPVEKYVGEKPLCSSILLIIESERNLVRLTRENSLNAFEYEKCIRKLRRDCELIELRELTIELCLNNLFPPLLTPKTNDLVHLRTALWFRDNGGLDVFVTLDGHQKRAAVDFGLKVF